MGPFGDPEEGSPCRTRRLHHRANVVHPLLECRKIGFRHAIRESGASLVEQDEA
jgi:hypothetical protein